MNYCHKDGFNKSNAEIRDKTSNEYNQERITNLHLLFTTSIAIY